MKKFFCLLVVLSMAMCSRAMAGGKPNTDAAEPAAQSSEDTNMDATQASTQSDDDTNLEATQASAQSSDEPDMEAAQSTAHNGDEPNMEATQSSAKSNDEQNLTLEEAGAEVVQFDGEKLGLAWQADNDGDTIKEFIPAGENLDTWKKLAAVREFPKVGDAREFAELMVQKLREDSPDAPNTITKNDKTGEVVLDFVAWPKDKSFVEFNVWKFRPRPQGGIFAEQFAVRDYKDPEGFVKNLKNVRERLVDAMSKGGLQQEAGK